MDALAEMYSLLNEEDMWAGLWQQRCRYPETATAIAYETQGFYEQAQSAYEMVIKKFPFSLNLRWRLRAFSIYQNFSETAVERSIEWRTCSIWHKFYSSMLFVTKVLGGATDIAVNSLELVIPC